MTAHWSLKRLGDIFDIARGGSPRPIEKFITDDPDGLNWIKIGDATASGKFIAKTKEKIRREGLSKTRFVNPGDFVLTNSMSFGRPYIMATDGCIHDGWLVLKPRIRELIHPDYFYYLLGSDEIYRQFAARAGGSTVKNLNTEIVSSVEVRLPPVDEQRRIAAILDKADALRRKRKRALALLDSLTQSIFLKMFGDPNAHERASSREAPLLGDVADVLSGAGFPNEDQGRLDEEIPFFKVSDMNLAGNETWMCSANNYVSREAAIRLGAKIHPPLTVIFPKIGAAIATNKKRLLRSSSCFDNNVVGLHAKDGQADPLFLYGWLKMTDISKFAQPGNPPSIRKSTLQEAAIRVPPYQEQQQFSSVVRHVWSEMDRAANSAGNLDHLFASLQSRAFSGQL